MLKKAYDSPGGKEFFTGDCLDLKKMFIGYRECALGDVVEIDTFKELQDFDSAYRI